MKALVTGITGFAGGHLAEHLLASGDQVLGTSRCASWPTGTPAELVGSVPLVAWDIEHADAPAEEFESRIRSFRPDCIYHLAALSVPADCGDAEPTPRALAANVEGLSRVLALARRLPSTPKVLFTSTSHVYAPMPSPDARLTEEAPLGPRRGYGKSKLAAEQRVAAAGGLHIIVARSFQHTGPRQAARMMLPEWAEQFAREGREPVRVITRDAHIDLSDVRDVVRAYRLLMEHGQDGGVYNVGSGQARRSGDVLDQLQELADPDRAIVELRPGARYDPIADVSRLGQRTGWRPEIPLDQTIADTWEFWRSKAAAVGDAS